MKAWNSAPVSVGHFRYLVLGSSLSQCGPPNRAAAIISHGRDDVLHITSVYRDWCNGNYHHQARGKQCGASSYWECCCLQYPLPPTPQLSSVVDRLFSRGDICRS